MAQSPAFMDWFSALGQAFATVFGAVLVYVLGQLLVKLTEPVFALRALIGRIAGDLLMYANRDDKLAGSEERLKIFRRDASDLHQLNATVVVYWLFSLLRILPPKVDVEEAAKNLISFSNSQVAPDVDMLDYFPQQREQNIRHLLKISDPDTPGKIPPASQ